MNSPRSAGATWTWRKATTSRSTAAKQVDVEKDSDLQDLYIIALALDAGGDAPAARSVRATAAADAFSEHVPVQSVTPGFEEPDRDRVQERALGRRPSRVPADSDLDDARPCTSDSRELREIAHITRDDVGMSTCGKHDDCSVDDVVRLRLGEDPPNNMGIGFIELDNLATGEQSTQLCLLRRTTHLSDDWSGDDDGET